MIPNFELRARARKAIKPMMQVLLVIALVAALPNLISDTVTLVTKTSPAVAFTPVLDDYMDLYEQLPELTDRQLLVQMAQILRKAEDILTEYMQGKGVLWGAMTLMDLLLTPALMMGLYRALICALRSQEPRFSMAWPGVKRFFKGIAVSLLTFVMALLWALPGILLATLGLTFLPISLASLGYTAGLGLAVVLAVRAIFSYEMAPFIIADAPETGLFAAMKKSRQVMHGRRMPLFSLELTFYLWAICLSMLQTMLQAMLGNVIGLTLGMFVSLFLQVYMYGTIAQFYELYVVKGLKPQMTMPPLEDEGEQLTDSDENDGNTL